MEFCSGDFVLSWLRWSMTMKLKDVTVCDSEVPREAQMRSKTSWDLIQEGGRQVYDELTRPSTWMTPALRMLVSVSEQHCVNSELFVHTLS